MKKVMFILASCSFLYAEVNFSLNIDLAPKFDSPPPVIVVSPGISVVPDCSEEIFVVNNYYWIRHHDHWYKSRGSNERWIMVTDRRVPRNLMKMPRGKYKNWNKDKDNHKHKGH